MSINTKIKRIRRMDFVAYKYSISENGDPDFYDRWHFRLLGMMKSLQLSNSLN